MIVPRAGFEPATRRFLNGCYPPFPGFPFDGNPGSRLPGYSRPLYQVELPRVQ